MPAARTGLLRRFVAAAILTGIAQSALAWDYVTDGSDSIYAGHSSAMLTATGDASLSFSCTRSARGMVLLMLEIIQEATSADEEVIVVVEVDGRRFDIPAVSFDAGGVQGATTFSRQTAVTELVDSLEHSEGRVLVRFAGRILEFAGAKDDANFARMLEVCG